MTSGPTRTTTNRLTRRTAHVALAVVTGLGLAACSASGPSPGERGSRLLADDGYAAVLPELEAGVVAIDGERGSPSVAVNRAYRGSVGSAGTEVRQGFAGQSRAFQRLCRGEIDLVDSTRPMLAGEWDQCRVQGLDIVQFHVAAEAVVLAANEESALGGRCLSTSQVDGVFGAGTTITRWSQVDEAFDDLPVATSGPDIDTPGLQIFASSIFGSPAPSLGDFSADYRAFDLEDETRDFVVGSPVDEANVSRYLPVVAPRRERFRVLLLDALAQLARARSDVRRAVGASAAAPGPTSREDVLRAYAARRAALAETTRLRAIYGPLNARFLRLRAAEARVEAARGRIGIFRQGYAAQPTSALSPLAIKASTGDDQDGCTPPTQQTISSGQYPLARHQLITTTTRSLERAEVADYLSYYLRVVTTVARRQHLTALPEQEIATQLTWIAESDYPAFAPIDGGSVGPLDQSATSLSEPPPTYEVPAR